MAKTTHYKKTYQRTKIKTWGSRFLTTAFLSLLFVFMVMAGIFAYFAKDLPRPEKFTELAIQESTKIYDSTGEVLLYELFGDEKRDIVPLGDISKYLQEAVLATEDAGFYSHFGLSLTGTARAVLVNLGLKKSQVRFGSAQGGSTISQQLIRSSFLTRQKTLERKVRELILTLELERRYSKDDILGFYLNQIFLGSNIYGMSAASQAYFHKLPSELALEEAAALAALIQAPSYYSPFGKNVDELLQRKNYVLLRMAEEGFITPEEAEQAKQREIIFLESSPVIKAPHFTFFALDELLETYGEEFLRQNGLVIKTSLDWELQQLAERLVFEKAEQNKAFRAHNAALVAINPRTGEILAMVGSKDWFGESSPAGCTSGKDCLFDPKVNIATFSQGRQPGSAFKPFVYAAAFENGYDDKTTVIDEETNFGIWGGEEYIPQNYDGLFRGKVTLRQALAQSLNVPSVKVLANLAGIENSIALAKELGITTLNKDPSFYGLSLVLGGGEVRLLDIASAYGVFAQGGKKTPPLSVVEVIDSFGILIERRSHTPVQVLSPAVASLITDILSDNEARTPLFGPRSVLYFPDHKVAVKTGTTQLYKDAWTVGYTQDLVVAVWAGNNDSSPTAKQPGVLLVAPLWSDFMKQALEILETRNSDN